VIGVGPANRPSSASPTETLAPPAELGCHAGRLFFTSERDGNRELYRMCPDGQRLERLTTSPVADHLAAASSDGKLAVLSFEGHPGEPGYAEHLTLFADDGTLRPVAPSRPRLRNPTWLTGALGLVVETDRYGFSDLERIGLDGRRERLTSDPAGSYEPTASPDGKQLVFVSSRDGDAELYRANLDGKELLRLTHSRGDDSSPVFSPDGARLAFVSTRRGPARVHVMNADGSRPRALDDEPTIGEAQPVWSPDGAWLAYIVAAAESSSLRVVRVDDGAVVAEDRGAFRDETPTWSPDGRWLVFASNREGDVELYAMRREGGAVVRLTKAPGVDFLPRWLADKS
jgi:Tol biopolymer transport system component